MLENIRCILVNTSHPGNIGAAARAMKTMNLAHLYLVDPWHFPHADATARASGADDILEQAVVVPTLDAALEECGLIIGTSARQRYIDTPLLTPRECAYKLQQESQQHPVALVFGREKTGLTNDELLRCHYHVNIPTNPEYSSLNVAAAVQILAYEINSLRAEPLAITEDNKVTAAEMELFYTHLEQTLTDLEFLNPAQPRQLMRRLRRLFNRVRIEETEMHILRGILAAAQKAVHKN